MPLNPNKKIDRSALPEPKAETQTGEYVPPRDEVEQKLANLWLEVLDDETAAHTSLKIGAYSDFFESGGHSLKILNLVNAVQRDFNVKLDFQDVFQFPLWHCVAYPRVVRPPVPESLIEHPVARSPGTPRVTVNEHIHIVRARAGLRTSGADPPRTAAGCVVVHATPLFILYAVVVARAKERADHRVGDPNAGARD